jgi:undecaprenyl-diphosphatase
LSGAAALSFLRLGLEILGGELGLFDEAVSHSVGGLRGTLDTPMLVLTHTGGFEGMTLLCAVSVLVLARLRKTKEASFVAACGSGALIFSSALKLMFHRARPDVSVLYLIQTPNSFSFPSGHAMGSTTVVGSLVVVAFALGLAWPWRALMSAVALFYVFGVACSRVYFGVHFPSDVIGGCLAGAAWVAATTGWFYPRLLPGEASGPPETRQR